MERLSSVTMSTMTAKCKFLHIYKLPVVWKVFLQANMKVKSKFYILDMSSKRAMCFEFSGMGLRGFGFFLMMIST